MATNSPSPFHGYFAGNCSVCPGAGAATFLKSVADGRIFFGCAECGCAWLRPPTPSKVDTIDPPTAFAPGGFTLATRDEIDSAGLADMIAADQADFSSSGFLGIAGYLAGAAG